MPRAQLLTEQNTGKVFKLIIRAAAAKFGNGKASPYFEHGQWWITIDAGDHDLIYSVVDSYPSIANTGLDFEQVS